MKGIGQRTSASLKALGLEKVNDLLEYKDNPLEIKKMQHKCLGSRRHHLPNLLRSVGMQLKETLPQTAITHKQQIHTKASMANSGEKKIATSSTLSSSVCITKMIKHMINEGQKKFKETQYQNSWVFYHNALKLMVANKTQKWWLESKGYLKRWIGPKRGVCNDIDRQYGHFVGNQLEKMPLDNKLNKDVHKA